MSEISSEPINHPADVKIDQQPTIVTDSTPNESLDEKESEKTKTSDESNLLKQLSAELMELKERLINKSEIDKKLAKKNDAKRHEAFVKVQLIVGALIQIMRPAEPTLPKTHPDYERTSFMCVLQSSLHLREYITVLLRDNLSGLDLLKEYTSLTGKPFRSPFICDDKGQVRQEVKNHPIAKFNAKWLLKVDEVLTHRAAPEIVQELTKRAALPFTTVFEAFNPEFFREKFDNLVTRTVAMLVMTKDLVLLPKEKEMDSEWIKTTLSLYRRAKQLEAKAKEEKTNNATSVESAPTPTDSLKDVPEFSPQDKWFLVFSDELRQIFQTYMVKLHSDCHESNQTRLKMINQEALSMVASTSFLFCQRTREYSKGHLQNVCSNCKEGLAYPLICDHCKEPVKLKLTETFLEWVQSVLFPEIKAIEQGHHPFVRVRAQKDFEDLIRLSYSLIMRHQCHARMTFFAERRAMLCAMVFEQNQKLGEIVTKLFGNANDNDLDNIAQEKHKITLEEYSLFGNLIKKEDLKDISGAWFKRKALPAPWKELNMQERLFVILIASPADILRMISFVDFQVDDEDEPVVSIERQ